MTSFPFWVNVMEFALLVVHWSVTDCPAVTVVGVAVRVAVGPSGGGGAVTVTVPDAVAALVPAAPVAVSVNVAVPTVLSVNCIPGDDSGLPSSRTSVPFWARDTEVAF